MLTRLDMTRLPYVPLSDNVHDQVEPAARKQVTHQVWSKTMVGVMNPIAFQVREQVWMQVRDRMWGVVLDAY